MRNLKRALSLTLASVMLLGMMVVGSSAAAGYDDVADTDNVEAIEVLQAVEVMVGDERGFGPERPVNRAEMAVVMGKLLNLDYNYYEATCPFNDVYDWARGWVGACYANGIVSGRGEGVYDPGTTVTAVEAASMLMRALGYFKYQSDYANGFEVATVSQATKIRLFDGVDSKTNAPLTRNQVAQMVLNALKSGVVEPDGNALNFIDANGNVIATGGKVNYVYTTSNKSFATAISSVNASSMGSYNDAPIVELGEQLYNGDLKLNDTTDVFGRPARQWEYDAKEIGTYVKKELLKQEYTTEVTGKMLYNLLTKPTIDKYDFTISIDGIQCVEANRTTLGEAYFTETNLVNTNTKAVGATDKGVLTQVFVDPDKDNQDVYIAVINTYLAKAVDDYKTNKEEVDFTVWSVENKGSRSDIVLVKNTEDSEVLTVKNEDIFVEDVKEDDIVLVRVAEGEIQEIYDPEVIDNTEISAFKEGDWVNAGGTQYDYADSIQYDTEVLDEYDDKNMKDTTYRVFLDMYGYAIGVEIIDEADNYVFLTGIDVTTSNLYNKTADGNVIHLDGSMETVRINMDKSRNAYNAKFNSSTGNGTKVNSLMNTWCTYAVDSNGVYTLTEVAKDERTFTTKFDGDNAIVGYGAGEKRSYDKIGQGRNDEDNTRLPLTLDKAHAGLRGIDDSGFRTVHANDDTVFLTVSTEYIIATDVLSTTVEKKDSIIINDVETVDTGIQNVDITAHDAAWVLTDGGYNTAIPHEDVSHGVYTLFKDNGYVIAAVVVGEDDGTSSNYAFVTSGSVKQEAYDKNADEYTWSRDVVINGEKVTLEEKGDTNPYLKSMSRGNWYEVKYNSDGTVRRTTLISQVDTAAEHADRGSYVFCLEPDHMTTGYPKFIGLIEMREASYDAGNNTIVLYENLTDRDYEISARGRTLQVDTKESGVHRDITVTSNAKVVLVQDVQKYDSNHNPVGSVAVMDRVEECGEGQNGLKKAVDWLEDNSYFRGYVGAVVEDGVATSVVIYDTTASEINIGGDNRPVSGDATLVWDKYDEEWTLTIPAKDYRDNLTTAEIADWLAKAGCTEISKTRSGWNFVRNGMTYNDQIVNVVPRGDLKVTVYDIVDGNSKQVDSWWTEAGESETIDIGSYTGYEVDTLYVDGNDVTEDIRGGSYTFTMPNHDVVVKVTFKKTETPPVGGEDVTVTFGEGAKFLTAGDWDVVVSDGPNKDKTLAKGEGLKVGDVFTFDPFIVLSVADGAELVNDGTDGKPQTWKVTDSSLTVKTRNGAYLLFGDWMWVNGDQQWPATAATEDNGARARRGWTDDVLKAPVYSLITMDDGGKVILVITFSTDEGIKFAVEGENADKYKVDDVLFQTNVDGKWTVPSPEKPDIGGEDPKPADSFVKAVITRLGASYSAKITEYDKDGKKVDALTAKQVADALNSAKEKYGLTFAEGDVKLDKNANASYALGTDSTGTKVNVALDLTKAVPTQVFKVTYPGGEIYTDASGETVTNIDKDVYYLLPSDVVMSNGTGVISAFDGITGTRTGTAKVVPVTNTKQATDSTLAEEKDTEYTAGMQLAIATNANSDNGLFSGGNIVGEVNGTRYHLLNASTADPNDGLMRVPFDGSQYVQVGTTIYVTPGTATKEVAANKGITLKVNGKDAVNVAVDKDGKFKEQSFKIPAEPDKNHKVTFAVEVTTPDVPVYVNNGTTALKRYDNGTPNDATDDYYIVENTKGMVLVYMDKDTEKYTLAGADTPDYNGNTKLTVSALAGKGMSEDRTRIDLYTAWTVADEGTGNLWKSYISVNGVDGKTEDKSTEDYGSYFRTMDKGTVYIVAATPGVWLSKADSIEAPGLLRRSTLNGAVTPNGTTPATAVWAVTVTSNITVDDYEALITVDEAVLNTIKGWETNGTVNSLKGGTPEPLLTGTTKLLTLGEKITGIEATFVRGKDLAEDNNITVDCKLSSDGTYIELSIEADEDITQTSALQELGTITLDVGKYTTVTIPVNVAASTSP